VLKGTIKCAAWTLCSISSATYWITCFICPSTISFHPVSVCPSNAIAEGVNSVIRDIDGHGRGYTFEILRAKALFYLNHKTVKPKYGTNVFHNMLYGSFNLYDDDKGEDYGVPLSEIKEAILAGFFD
jgi:hypothetical protein